MISTSSCQLLLGTPRQGASFSESYIPHLIVGTLGPPLYTRADVRLDVNQPFKLRSTMQSRGEAVAGVHCA